MAFELENIVPWGRSYDEYLQMFDLSDDDLEKMIIGFGDGPASFNALMRQNGHKVISCDPLYHFSKEEILQRINETKNEVVCQTRKNMDNFVWQHIKTVEELESTRMRAMTIFLEDYITGKKQGRYLPHALPEVPVESGTADIGLSSHFLFLYDSLGLDFHIKSIIEMLRICNEIRIFPLLDLNATKSKFVKEIIKHFEKMKYQIRIQKVNYEFQRGGNEVMSISK